MADRRFFSSLKQSEDRITSESGERKRRSNNPVQQESPSMASSSPLFLGTPRSGYLCLTDEDSDVDGPPVEFLLSDTTTVPDSSVEEDLCKLTCLLGLSKNEGDDDEERRLDRWIRYYYSGGIRNSNKGKKEPLRLAHLILAKAACSDSTGCFDFGEFEISPALDEYFRYDPKSIDGEADS